MAATRLGAHGRRRGVVEVGRHRPRYAGVRPAGVATLVPSRFGHHQDEGDHEDDREHGARPPPPDGSRRRTGRSRRFSQPPDDDTLWIRARRATRRFGHRRRRRPQAEPGDDEAVAGAEGAPLAEIRAKPKTGTP